MRRAEAAVTGSIARPSSSIRRVISSPTSRRAATISASVTVPAEITIAVSLSRTSMQSPASLSPSTIAISAEVSTAIIRASHPLHKGSPDFSPRFPLPAPWRHRKLVPPRAVFCVLRAGRPPRPGPTAPQPCRAWSEGSLPRLGAADQFRQLPFGIGYCNPHRGLRSPAVSSSYGPDTSPCQLADPHKFAPFAATRHAASAMITLPGPASGRRSSLRQPVCASHSSASSSP